MNSKNLQENRSTCLCIGLLKSSFITFKTAFIPLLDFDFQGSINVEPVLADIYI